MQVIHMKGLRLGMKEFISILEWIYCGVNIPEYMDCISLPFIPYFV